MTLHPSARNSSGDGLVWHPLSVSDLDEAVRLSSSFGWPHRAEDWRAMLALGVGVAGRAPDGTLIATGMRWTFARTVTLGLITVASNWQGRGVGHAIMRRLISATSAPLLLHATEAGRRLYAGYGFRSVGRARQLQGVCAGPVESERVRQAEPREHHIITTLDAVAFGDRRDALIAALLACGTALVSVEEGVVTGFAIQRNFGRGTLIGPVVATSGDVALELTLASLVPGFNRVDLAVDDPGVVAALGNVGLTDAGTVMPMVRGDWPARTGPSNATRFALASQAFG